MKRFVVFHYLNYYPNGGWGDFKGAFDTKEEAEKKLAELIEDLDRIYVTAAGKSMATWTHAGHVIDLYEPPSQEELRDATRSKG